MIADIIEFPSLPGNPEDPNLAVLSNVLRESKAQTTDAECRTFAREFGKARERHDRETRGMTKLQRLEYQIRKLMELLVEAG